MPPWWWWSERDGGLDELRTMRSAAGRGRRLLLQVRGSSGFGKYASPHLSPRTDGSAHQLPGDRQRHLWSPLLGDAAGGGRDRCDHHRPPGEGGNQEIQPPTGRWRAGHGGADPRLRASGADPRRSDDHPGADPAGYLASFRARRFPLGFSVMQRWKSQKARWEKEVLEKARANSPEREQTFRTSSGAPLDPIYAPDAIPEDAYSDRLGFPGEYPFTRGIQPTMYRSRFWTMRQYAGFGSAQDANLRYHYLLKSGQTGLSVAFDLPTQMGFDADHPRARGEVGTVGVSISSLAEMELLLKGIPLADVSTSMTINATAPILLCLYAAVGERTGVAAELSGTIQNDILKEYIARGTYIYPPKPSLRLVTNVFAYCAQHIPRWNPISISGYHIREAGSTAAQEIAFTLGNGIAYVDAALQADLPVDSFAPRLSFFFNVHNHFLEEVAKFRAARRLWAKIMKERFKAKDPRSMMLRFHAQTAGSTLTAQQPDNNVVRVSLQALAAVLGGCQSLHTNSRDEALALPSEDAARLALRTQQIIAHETGVADAIDALGGSYHLE